MNGTQYDAIKRPFDAIVAAITLVVTAPVQIAVALLVWRRLGRPVLFRQQRPGRGGKPFTLIKFRTMREAHDGVAESDAQRLTPLGSTLRATSLDELPTLWNVLRGDMSLVGPRPLLMRYSPYFTEREASRLQVRPGMTGLAQASGRNEVPWDQRLELDAQYVESRSPVLDLTIILRTVRTVLRRDGYLRDPQSIMLNLDVERASERR